MGYFSDWKRSTVIEFLLATLILFATYKIAIFFFSAGYLPPPFFDEASDTFMDWYNTAYWAYRPGIYSEWMSVYPPLSFLFLRLFSIRACYNDDPFASRVCDPVGVWVITIFTVINVYLIYKDFKKADKINALPRTLALGLGLPALFAWERGNLIVPCFTLFILAHGRALRWTWLRWICFGAMANLKPYLVIVVIGKLIRRKWRWVEGCALACLLVYVVSYIVLGRGSPLELYADTVIFSGSPGSISLDFIEYATTYNSMLDILKTALPLMHFIGSRPMELVELVVPWAMKLGLVGVLLCYAMAVWKPYVLSSYRLSAMSIVLLLTISRGAGGYAELFLIYFVFQEKWEGIGKIVALVTAYILCVPMDFMIIKIIHAVTDSYLSGRAVGYDFGLTLGAVARPGLLLILEYALVAASLMDLYRSVSLGRVHSIRAEPGEMQPAAPAID